MQRLRNCVLRRCNQMARERMQRRERDRTERAEWVAKTSLGRRVQAGEVTSFDQLLETGAKILEPGIVDVLLPDLKEEVIEISSTQRMTAYGRKQKMRAVVVMGSGSGFVSVGVGKAVETRDAIGEAITDAKKNLVKVRLGCGSWECSCGTGHSIFQTAVGHNSSTQIMLKPAPRGVGLVANETARKVLELAGVKDVWTFANGRTRNKLNMVLATIDALKHLNKLKQGTQPVTASEEAQEAKQEEGLKENSSSE